MSHLKPVSKVPAPAQNLTTLLTILELLSTIARLQQILQLFGGRKDRGEE